MTIVIQPSGYTIWAEIVLEVNAHLVDCPYPLVEEQAKRAARDFLRRSHCWRSDVLELLTTVAETPEYEFDPPTNAELLMVHSCYKGDSPDDEVDVLLPGEQNDYGYGQIDSTWKIGVADPVTLVLAPAPDANDVVLHGTVSYVTASNATGIPTGIWYDWRDGIACRAAARLVRQPKRPWSSTETYTMLMNVFEREVAKASRESGPVRRANFRSVPSVC
jgi:hypothetical protein